MARRTLAEFLDEFLKKPGDCAYVQRRGYRSVRWSYREVAEAAFRFARELEAQRVGAGDRVLIWGPNSAEWVAAFFGCVLRGAVVVPMDDAAAPEFALRVYHKISASLMVCSRAHAATAGGTRTFALEDWSSKLAAHSPALYPAASVAPQDPLEIVFTSGTTADPRGVVISHANVLANIAPLEAEIAKYLKYERFVHPVRFLNLLPLSHVFGQFLGIFLPQLLGGTVVFQETLKPSEIAASIRRERISVLVSVPRPLQALKEMIERDLQERNQLEKFRARFQSAGGKHFLHRWWIFRGIRRRFGWKFWAFISGGAALDRDTEEFWHRLGYAVVQGYGLTETTSLISVNHPFHLGRGSIGKVLAGREIKLAADGEILVRGGGVAAGYWDGHDLHPVSDQDGWYGTGDIGELDAAGNLYFKGRKKDVIVTPAGMNVHPADLEAALRRQPEVRDCAVVGLPRNGNAEPCAVLILRESGESGADAEGLVRRANESLAEHQRMRQWVVWPEEDFPRTSTQKPRRNQILPMVQAMLGSTPAQEMPASPLAELIGKISGRGTAGLSENSRLEEDLNLGSLERVELLGALEDRYQVDLSETRFAAVNTVGDLERMLQGHGAQRARFHYPRWVLRWPVTWIRLAVEYVLLLPAVFVLGWPEVVGRAKLRGERGPVLVVSNHVGDVDLGFVLAALPFHLRHRLATATGGEALEILRTPSEPRNSLLRIYDRIRWTLGVSLLNLFPLPREAGFRDSFSYAGECVDRGYSVLVFPEGHHTTTGELLPFRSGIGLLVNNLALPVVPMRIDGLFELKQAGKKFAAPGTVSVKVGAPVRFEAGMEPAKIAAELERIVGRL
jgi:long-chain acyl-CoA synthetase